MALFPAVSYLNLDGSSEDANYRYKMPALAVKFEGAKKMRKTVLLNLPQVSHAVGRQPQQLLTFLGQSVSASSNIEKDGDRKAYVAGHHGAEALQQAVFEFVRSVVTCRRCGNPETVCAAEGAKKRRKVFLQCKSCGGRTDLDLSDRRMSSFASQVPEYGSGDVAGAVGSARVEPADVPQQGADRLAKDAKLFKEQESKEDRLRDNRVRLQCPVCGHRTDKATCRKCRTSLATGSSCSGGVEDKQADDLLGSGGPEGLLVYLQANTPEPNQISSLLATVVQRLLGSVGLDLSAAAQPVHVAEVFAPAVLEWAPVLDFLSQTAPNEGGVAMMVATLQEAMAEVPGTEAARGRAVVGVLLCFRDKLESVTDSSLIEGIQELPACSLAMKKFVEFLHCDSEDEEQEEESG